MANATFVHTGGTITFTRALPRPDQVLNVIQPQRTTSAGVRFGYSHTIIAQTMRLQLRMTTAQKEQLLAFFNTIVNGMAESFTYTDNIGTATAVRFDAPRLDGLIEKAYDSWETTVTLRVIT